MMQLHSGHGPCVEAYTTGAVVEVEDLELLSSRWPDFREEALAQGFRSVHAIPLRLRGTVIGTLNLFLSEPGLMSPEDASVARGLADVATIGILHERTIRENSVAREQLQHALDSRVLIEQAKGVIAQTRNVDMDAAFRILRAYARSNNLNLHDVAARVVARSVTP
jgi:GAF domain-containing protein